MPNRMALLALVIAAGIAADAAARAAEGAFQRFFQTATTHCRKAPAPACVERLWPIADRDGNGVLGLDEVNALYGSAQAWAGEAGRPAAGLERNLALVSLMVLRYGGIETVFANFDSNKDGALSRGEVFGDFRMDGRTFAELAADSDGVDWRAFLGKFGKAGILIRDLLPPSHKRQ